MPSPIADAQFLCRVSYSLVLATAIAVIAASYLLISLGSPRGSSTAWIAAAMMPIRRALRRPGGSAPLSCSRDVGALSLICASPTS